MKDLIQEGRKIQETFKKKVVNEQTLNEGKISDFVQKLKEMAKKEAKSRYEELAQFLDVDKIRMDKPKVSFSEIESGAIKSLKSIQTDQPTEGIVKEDFSSFFASIKNNVRSLVTSVSTFMKGLSVIPSALKLVKYIKDPKGLMKYYSDNMTTDGITYKGLSKTKMPLENIQMNESVDPGVLVAIIASIMIPFIIIAWIMTDSYYDGGQGSGY